MVTQNHPINRIIDGFADFIDGFLCQIGVAMTIHLRPIERLHPSTRQSPAQSVLGVGQRRWNSEQVFIGQSTQYRIRCLNDVFCRRLIFEF